MQLEIGELDFDIPETVAGLLQDCRKPGIRRRGRGRARGRGRGRRRGGRIPGRRGDRPIRSVFRPRRPVRGGGGRYRRRREAPSPLPRRPSPRRHRHRRRRRHHPPPPPPLGGRGRGAGGSNNHNSTILALTTAPQPRLPSTLSAAMNPKHVRERAEAPVRVPRPDARNDEYDTGREESRCDAERDLLSLRSRNELVSMSSMTDRYRDRLRSNTMQATHGRYRSTNGDSNVRMSR